MSLQAFFHVDTSPAYGICMACHGQELAAWLFPFDIRGVVHPVSVPLLTTVGVVVGAGLAARRNREFRRPRGGFNSTSALLGAGVGFAAIVALGCPTRLWLRLGYGDGTVLLPIVGLVLGILVAVIVMKRRAGHV